MRTLSARILLGFAALTLTFGVITATVVRNMGDVEDEILLIGKGFVPLALVSKNLARSQDDLKTYVEERFTDETNPSIAKRTLARLAGKRNRDVAATVEILDKLDQQIEVDPRQFRVTRPNLESLQKDVAETAAQYDAIAAAPPIGDPTTFDAAHKAAQAALDKLRTQERTIWLKTNQLSQNLEARVEHITPELEAAGHTVRLRTIYLGGVAVLLGLLVTIWGVITLRPLRRLRDAARRIAAGDYATRAVERGPAEVADLAREFNSMSRAVQERERELVRSERLAAVGTMAAMITHEVRNPLSSIGLNTELLEEELADNAEARTLCRAITHEVDRLTEITEEYLAFARLPKPKIAPEAVNELVAALAAFVREDLAAKHVELATELGADNPIALIDAAQLRQCLVNLVRNAAEAVAGRPGGGHIAIRTRFDREKNLVAIEVADDGVGIPPDIQPKLFDPFFSTKDGGSGLGLALTRQIVKDHGGDIAVASTVGTGTTFTVSVPAGPQLR